MAAGSVQLKTKTTDAAPVTPQHVRLRPAPLEGAAKSTRQPVLYAALAFATGLWVGKHAWRPPEWWVFAAVIFLASANYFLRRRPRWAVVLVYCAILFSGALTIQVQGHAIQPGAIWLGDCEQVKVAAHVISEGEVQQDGPGFSHQRLDIETEKIESDSESRLVHAGVRLNIFQQEKSTGTPSMRLFRYGERIRFSAELNQPRNYRNPGSFDYAGYLRDKGIVASASAKYRDVEVVPGFEGSRVQAWRAAVRRRIISKIHLLWAERVAGLMDAIVIGEEAFVERPARVDFQRSGTYHVLVVSGMNVSILALFTTWGLRRLRLGEIPASIIAIALILAYAAVTNVGPPVWRAALMFAIYLATRLLYRDRAMLNALGAAALALMVADPESLFGASFQMTFLCVLQVGSICLPLLDRTVQPYSRGLRNLDVLA